MTVVVLLGAPGAGKGTQAPILAQHLGIPHVATGDLFRAAVRDGSPVGLQALRYMERGQLVPDDITIAMLLDRLTHADATDGVILDGFPRNRAQAVALDAALAARGTAVSRALSVDVPADELVRRLSGRWVCSASGHVYNEHSNPPRVLGMCDLDESPLIQREDDKAETIRARMDLTLASLSEVAEYYQRTGILRSVDGVQSISAVTTALVAKLGPDATSTGTGT
ncbi:MAG: adenylate kinase [Candidatus Limnocylindrales bacterium]